jgi:hypothetical protein
MMVWVSEWVGRWCRPRARTRIAGLTRRPILVRETPRTRAGLFGMLQLARETAIRRAAVSLSSRATSEMVLCALCIWTEVNGFAALSLRSSIATASVPRKEARQRPNTGQHRGRTTTSSYPSPSPRAHPCIVRPRHSLRRHVSPSPSLRPPLPCLPALHHSPPDRDRPRRQGMLL